LVGQLYIEGDLRVSGTVDGALEATGDIEIAGGGKVSGAVTAYNRLVVGGNASLIGGEVRVARLTVEDGATFTGRVSMGKHTAESPKPAEPESIPEPQAVEAIPVVESEPPKPTQDWGLTTPKRRKGR
jgi:cytoskeletal protein CcmA (bactofilin family)